MATKTAIEVGNQFKSVSNVLATTWVVQRIIDGPVPHAILTQTGDANSIRTLSLSALEDTHMFQRIRETTPFAAPIAKKGTVRGFLRIAPKAA